MRFLILEDEAPAGEWATTTGISTVRASWPGDSRSDRNRPFGSGRHSLSGAGWFRPGEVNADPEMASTDGASSDRINGRYARDHINGRWQRSLRVVAFQVVDVPDALEAAAIDGATGTTVRSGSPACVC
jgi:hypothetical protein